MSARKPDAPASACRPSWSRPTWRAPSPLASEAALFLVRAMLDNAGEPAGLGWFILPLGNPDAAANY